MSFNQGFPQLDLQFVDPQTGKIRQPWLQVLLALWNRTGGGIGIDLAADDELVAQLVVVQGADAGQLQAQRAQVSTQLGNIAAKLAAAPSPADMNDLMFVLLNLAMLMAATGDVRISQPELPDVSAPNVVRPELPAVILPQGPPAAPQWPAAPVTSRTVPTWPPPSPAAVEPPPVAPFAITPGASPFVYQASYKGEAIVSGGAVTTIEFSRDGGTSWTAIPGGLVPLRSGDQTRVTYTIAPTMTFIGF